MKPIIEIVERMHHDLMEQKEEAIIKAVNKFDVVVDKERLMQALKDAKAFYDEGYRDAMNTAVSLFANIVHCRECKIEQICKYAQYLGENGFCSYGERRVE